MLLKPEQIPKLVAAPSLGAITYQGRVLIEELEAIREKEYPAEAHAVRDVFLCLATYVTRELWDLYDPTGESIGLCLVARGAGHCRTRSASRRAGVSTAKRAKQRSRTEVSLGI